MRFFMQNTSSSPYLPYVLTSRQMPSSSLEPHFFAEMEQWAQTRENLTWDQRGKTFLVSGLGHVVLVGLAVLIPYLAGLIELGEETTTPAVRVRFWVPGGEGLGGGGGGGGSGGQTETAYVRTMVESPLVVETHKSRDAPIAPRKPRLVFGQDLDVLDLPDDTEILLNSVFSPDATDFPGLSVVDSVDRGGIDQTVSAGMDGGLGGGTGTGVGIGEGWGVGEGRGGGYGGGNYQPGAYDIEPELVYKPPSPPYPQRAREKMITGEVILQILVKLDGSTEVLGVIKSLPFCVAAAQNNAQLWRWKPAMREGKPVEALGIIEVSFELFSQGS